MQIRVSKSCTEASLLTWELVTQFGRLMIKISIPLNGLSPKQSRKTASKTKSPYSNQSNISALTQQHWSNVGHLALFWLHWLKILPKSKDSSRTHTWKTGNSVSWPQTTTLKFLKKLKSTQSLNKTNLSTSWLTWNTSWKSRTLHLLCLQPQQSATTNSRATCIQKRTRTAHPKTNNPNSDLEILKHKSKFLP